MNPDMVDSDEFETTSHITDLEDDASINNGDAQLLVTMNTSGKVVNEQWYIKGRAISNDELADFKRNIKQNNTLKQIGLEDLT